MRNVNYIGMGPYESYADKHHASWHGSFSASIDEMHEDYIMPQENGSHFDCSLVQVSAPGASDESDRNSSDKITLSTVHHIRAFAMRRQPKRSQLQQPTA